MWRASGAADTAMSWSSTPIGRPDAGDDGGRAVVPQVIEVYFTRWCDPPACPVGERELQRGIADPVSEIVSKHGNRIGVRQNERSTRQAFDLWSHRDRPTDRADDGTGGDEREVHGNDEGPRAIGAEVGVADTCRPAAGGRAARSPRRRTRRHRRVRQGHASAALRSTAASRFRHPSTDDPRHGHDQQRKVDREQGPNSRRRIRDGRRADGGARVPSRPPTRRRRLRNCRRSPTGRSSDDAGTSAKRGAATIIHATAAAPASHAALVMTTSDGGRSDRRAAPTTVSTPAAPIEARAMRETVRREASTATAAVSTPIPIASPEMRIRSIDVRYRVNSIGRRLSQPSQIETPSAAHEIVAARRFTPPLETCRAECSRESSCRLRAGS